MAPILDKSKELISRDAAVYARFGRIPYFPLSVARAEGARVWDLDGNVYLDGFSAACTANIGFNHPRVVDAAKKQIEVCVNFPSAYSYGDAYVSLAEEIVQIAPIDGPKRAFFGFSGSDAMDLVIKLARAATGRRRIVAFKGGYHGALYGSGSMTDLIPAMHDACGPFLADVTHVPYATCYRCPFGKKLKTCSIACLEPLRKLLAEPDHGIAAVVMEPVLGDGGLHVPPVEFVQGVARLCREAGALFCVDEVQQGLGRAGKWAAIENFGVLPDVIAFGKTLGGGFPISAVVARAEIMDAMPEPSHGFCMAAHATSAAAARAVLAVIHDEGLMERSMELGAIARARLDALQERTDLIGEIRGIGFNFGIDLVQPGTRDGHRDAAAKICAWCFRNGLILPFLGDGVVRFQPPLTLSLEDLDLMLKTFEAAIDAFIAGEIPDEFLEGVGGW